ncbi:MAG TPA: FkbM family methyltransferase [Vicinamibacterales bacterium]|nr:FkbM family methyltransferase [Vicinamibacterales bacterium]
MPGLRAHVQRLERLERRALDLESKLDEAREALHEERRRSRKAQQVLRGEARARRREFAEIMRARIERVRRRIARVDVIEALLPVRQRALVSASATAAGRVRAAQFEATSESYAAIRHAGAALEGTAAVDCYGMSFEFPVNEHDSGSLVARLRGGWLPVRDIAALRNIAFGPVMLDIGANVGTTALPRAVMGDAQLVLAAEPDPSNYACLVRNVIANGLEGVVLPDRVALSDRSGDSLLVHGTHMGTHHLTDSDHRAGGTRVRTMTLDAWIDSHNVDAASVGFIKCDTQGWEPKVLAGAKSVLHPHVVWQLEFHPGIIRRSGVRPVEFLRMLEQRFSSFIDLHGQSNELRPTSRLAEALEYLIVRHEQVYTDLILLSVPLPMRSAD